LQTTSRQNLATLKAGKLLTRSKYDWIIKKSCSCERLW